MAKTYTYTARDAQNPASVVTITLYPRFARVNLTGMWDQLAALGDAVDAWQEAGAQLASQATPITLKLIEALSGPIHLSDLWAELDGERLQLIAWQRVRGLRLAPVTLDIPQVDNLEAAAAFVDELAERRQSLQSPALFPGPLDYWAGWVGLAFAIFAVLWLRSSRSS